MNKLFELRGELSKRLFLVLTIIGTFGFLVIWHLVTVLFDISPGVFPSPIKVIAAFPELHFQDALVRNAIYSLKLNLLGMFFAFAAALPLGFLIGLTPLVRGLMEKQLSVCRYIPLTILIGVFICWFGFGDMMKTSFLAFGIFVYLLPTVVQRVFEVQEVYIQTAKTCGASYWQIVRTVFFPVVLSKTFTDVKILAPISWTYIIIAEMLNSTGGLGAMAYVAGRQSRADKAFAILLTIILIAVIMDQVFTFLDKKLFPYMYLNIGRN
jgi:NitT/TauT family transport system permease protein